MEIVAVGAEQPDLMSDVPAVRRAEATEATRAATLRVRRGPWAAEQLRGPPGHLGLLVLDGLIYREIDIGRRRYVELLGEGDLLRPWDPIVEASRPTGPRWTANSAARLAVLDRAFAIRIGGFPEITAALMERLVRRSRWLAVHVAIAHVPQLEARLQLTFWYLADRWGHVTPEGIVVPLPLSHELLGALVGAHRSPVTRALGRLRTAGDITRAADGSWLLCGRPPAEMPDLMPGAVPWPAPSAPV